MWGVCVHEEAQDVGALAVAAGLRVVRNDPLVAGRLLSATSIALACIYRACLHLSRLLALSDSVPHTPLLSALVLQFIHAHVCAHARVQYVMHTFEAFA